MEPMLNRVDMKNLFPGEKTHSICLAVLTVISLLILPACVQGWGKNDPDPEHCDRQRRPAGQLATGMFARGSTR